MSLISVTRRVLDAVLHDFAHSIRGFVRSPGACLAVIVTFGLGVGANAAVFTALDRVFFSLPPGVVKPGGFADYTRTTTSRRLRRARLARRPRCISKRATFVTSAPPQSPSRKSKATTSSDGAISRRRTNAS